MKVLVMLVVMMSMGCALDESYGREYVTKNATYTPVEEKIVVIKEYYDENGVQITDPDIITEIEND